ncbi:regulator of G protein signaling domain-domain-containing protein [Naematelia encephala]|uniref:Regulator of G protein signaling domain-domain-containing protein n=1 Tax=Naematelia encephala TaxID=71784 RepID=A0A1Y2BDG0_9TREE|nr:regulator of G protein signaling domain-domain-containing protein [Naematelia encephala]
MSSSRSHLMKTTRRGRPFVKDTHDLMATLLVSLPFGPHRSFFKTYPNSFTTDEAAANLASLKFSQSNRAADPKDPSRIITTTTTTTFSMSRDMAKGICQYFVDAHLIECASDLESTTFKDRGVYTVTPKGLHILERFMTKNGIAAPHLIRVFTEEPVTLKMLHLERRSNDDEIIITKSVVDVLWKRFAGREPNVSKLSDEDLASQFKSRWYAKASVVPGDEVDRSMGVILRKVSVDKKDEYQFSGLHGAEWILDYTTAVGLDEAAEVAAHFVRYGYLALVKAKVKEGDVVAVVRGGGAGGGAGAIMQEAEYRATEKAVYKITPAGIAAARWEIDGPAKAVAKSNPQSPDPPNSTSAAPRDSHSTDSTLQRAESVSDRTKVDDGGHVKDSHTARLRQVLEEPALRSLFREFLRSNFCEENLSFWLDVQDLRKKFGTTSSAVALPGQTAKGRTAGHQAMEKHQQDLITLAFVIYNTYLAPASLCELNIDHSLRAELITYMNQISHENAGTKGQSEPNTLHASQLQNIIRLYERIQTYIFRLMATDSVPKFCKTERFLNLMRSVFDSQDMNVDADILADLREQVAGLALGKDYTAEPPSPTKAYLTISQAANEKQILAAKQRENSR